jgi:flap endonuclease-1
MGIKGLMQLLKTEAVTSYKETTKKTYNQKVIAIDASIYLYQFLVQIRTKEGSGESNLLTNKDGEVTSHIQGFFTRITNLLENGIKPVFVFDGKPPVMKYSELEKRRESKKKAEESIKEAEERVIMAREDLDKDMEMKAIQDINKAKRMNIHVTKKHIEDIQHLLTIMGIPYIVAPCEAEAQCAELVKGNKVYAASTEDMDSLTFG